jgi:type IV pilus assembly protein PilV
VHLDARRPRAGLRARGFTLIELLVTLVVVAVGLMGLAKLQAAATAETQISRTRSIMTFQAESLAAAMRANRAYWGDPAGALPTISVPAGGTPVSSTDSTAADTATSCASYCAPATLAATDLLLWATRFGQQFPAATANIACSASSGPATCDITLSWPERFVAINRSTAPVTGDTAPTGTLVLHVQP